MHIHMDIHSISLQLLIYVKELKDLLIFIYINIYVLLSSHCDNNKMSLNHYAQLLVRMIMQ